MAHYINRAIINPSEKAIYLKISNLKFAFPSKPTIDRLINFFQKPRTCTRFTTSCARFLITHTKRGFCVQESFGLNLTCHLPSSLKSLLYIKESPNFTSISTKFSDHIFFAEETFINSQSVIGGHIYFFSIVMAVYNCFICGHISFLALPKVFFPFGI